LAAGTDGVSRTRAQTAATASWICFLVAGLGSAIARSNRLPLVGDALAFPLMLTGLGAGVMALTRLKAEGRKRILLPAAVGVMLNALFLSVFVTNCNAARQRVMPVSELMSPYAAVMTGSSSTAICVSPPNYTLHPPPGVGLGADFVRTFARRG